MQDSDTQTQALNDWQRLSPLASIYYLIRIIRILLRDALATLAPLFVLIITAKDKGFIISLIAIGAPLLFGSAALLQYWFFKFRLLDDRIEVNSGVIKRQHRVIHFERVQNINIEQPVYFRPFKLVTLMLETAGSKSGEGDLAGIPASQADTLRDLVLQKQKQAKAANQDQANQEEQNAVTEQDVTPIATASVPRLVRFGIANNNMLLALAFMSPLFSQPDKWLSKFISKEDIQLWSEQLGGGSVGPSLLILLTLSAFFLLISLISIAGSILRYYDFKLTLLDTTLKRRSGLINNYEESLTLNKLQALTQRCNYIGRWLKTETLVLSQAGGSANTPQSKACKFIVPAQTAQNCRDLIAILYPQLDQDLQTSPIHRRFMRLQLLRVLAVITPITVLLWIKVDPKALALMAVPFLLWPLYHQRWKKYRYGISNGYGVFRSGFIGHRYVHFPLFKVQRVNITQSPLQRRRNLATLTIYLASGRYKIPYMPVEDARAWFDEIYYHIESDTRPWF